MSPLKLQKPPIHLAPARPRLVCGCLLLLVAAFGGCIDDPSSDGELDVIWGRHGSTDGHFQKPRAMAINDKEEIFIVDMTARIQVFTPEGKFLRKWQTPTQANGRPSGLSIGVNGNILVADTHYFRMLVYTAEGKFLPDKTIGGTQGNGPGEFGFVTDALQDSQGNYYIAEYGEFDRIQKFDADGKYLLEWGGHGAEPGQFVRPQNLAFDKDENIWVVDACNHRVQEFTREGKLLRHWGVKGTEPGQLSYPYDLAFDKDGNLYLVEYGNHRVQKFTPEGKSLGCWGTHGRGPGQMHNPWALIIDRQGRIQVLDTNNHRVQRIYL